MDGRAALCPRGGCVVLGALAEVEGDLQRARLSAPEDGHSAANPVVGVVLGLAVRGLERDVERRAHGRTTRCTFVAGSNRRRRGSRADTRQTYEMQSPR